MISVCIIIHDQEFYCRILYCASGRQQMFGIGVCCLSASRLLLRLSNKTVRSSCFNSSYFRSSCSKHRLELTTRLTRGISPVNSWRIVPCQPPLIMLWKNAREVNLGVKVNLWLVNPRVNLSMEQSALSHCVGNLLSYLDGFVATSAARILLMLPAWRARRTL